MTTQSSGWSDYYAPPIAAMASIVAPYRFFVKKSAQQLGQPVPKITIFEGVQGGLRASPTLGFTVGVQMVAQGAVEKWIGGGSKNPSFFHMFASSAFIGLISAAPLAAFNGQTFGRTVIESVKGLTIKQTGAIMVRETSFLFGVRISDPVSKEMQRRFGKNPVVDLTSAFTSGAISSLVGHPADTALTLWQRDIKILSSRQLMLGGPAKAIGVGFFTVSYKVINDLLK